MRRLLATRLALVLVTLLTLGACGERAFAHLVACDCLCHPAAAVVATVTPAGDGDLATAAGAAHLSAGETGKTVDDCHGANGNGCVCSCHAATFANVQTTEPALGPLRLGAATLHAGPPQSPSEGVRAGIEYPPRAA